MRKTKMRGGYIEPSKEVKFGGPSKMQDGGSYPTYKKDSDKAKSFREAFASARKSGKTTFEWDGRKYGTRRADENKEQHAAAMKKAAGSSEPKSKTPAPGTTPPGTPKKEAPARTTPSGGSGMGAKAKEDALKKEIDSAKPKAKSPAAKASNILNQDEFKSSKTAAASGNKAKTMAKFMGAEKVKASGSVRDKLLKPLEKASAPKEVSKKQARQNRKENRKAEATSTRSRAQKITDRTNREGVKKDRKNERVAVRTDRKLDRTAARYDRKIDSTTGVSKRKLNTDARKAKRAAVKTSAANAATAAADRKKAMGDAVEKDLKKRGLGYGGKAYLAGGLKDIPAENKGLPKLKKSVRNRMGFKRYGGTK